jgi:hypothetical protein
MRKSRFRDEQIIGILKEHQVGLREELSTLEARRVALTAQLANADSDDMPVLHPALAEVYRRKVAELTDALSDADRSAEAAGAIRALLRRSGWCRRERNWRSSLRARWPGSSASRMRQAPER